MSDNNNHITYSAADIEKYWKGQLSAAEQHAMEKAALEDPFLADAMEGYELSAASNPAVIAADITELEKRLAERVAEKKKAAVIPFGWWQIAAMLVVIAGAGWLYITVTNKNKQENTATVKNEQVQELKKDNAAPVTADSANTSITGIMDSSQGSLAINKRKTTAAGESKPGFIQPEYKKDAPPAASTTNDTATTATSEEEVVAANNDALEKKAAAAPPIARKETQKSVADPGWQRSTDLAINDDKAQNKALNGRANYQPANTFNGNLLDQSKKPVANAFIQIPNLNVTTQTDKKGYFSFKAADSVLTVSIASDGFETQNLRLHDSATLNQIILKPSPAALNEVVVQTNGAEKRKKSAREEISIKILDAEPAIGWDKYREYLDKNKKVDEVNKNIHGSVVVSFTVRNRSLNNFSIEQSLEEALDEEAIRLIKTGPSWKLLKGKKATATVIVRF